MRGSVAKQAQLAHHVTWLDPIDDGERVGQTCKIKITQMGVTMAKV